MLDGIWLLFDEEGNFLGQFQDNMQPELLVCAYVYSTTHVGAILHMEETRARRAMKVRVVGKSLDERFGHLLTFEKECNLKFPLKKPHGLEKTWVHEVADFLRIGKYPRLAKFLSIALPLVPPGLLFLYLFIKSIF